MARADLTSAIQKSVRKKGEGRELLSFEIASRLMQIRSRYFVEKLQAAVARNGIELGSLVGIGD